MTILGTLPTNPLGTFLALCHRNRTGKESEPLVDIRTVERREEPPFLLPRDPSLIECLQDPALTIFSVSPTLSSSYFGDGVLFLPLRRNHPRYSIQNIASYRHEDKNFLTLTLNLSLGGMKIKTCHPLSQDEELGFKLVLNRNPISLKGRIVYSQFLPDKQGVSGIEFIEISDRDRTALKNYLDSIDQWLKKENSPF
jgi:hypothetical protein